jgi:hypothetical protein
MHLDIDTGQITEDLDQGRKWSVSVATPSEGRAAREEEQKAIREAKAAEKATLAEQRAEYALLANVGKVVEAIRKLGDQGKAPTITAIGAAANLNNEKTRGALARAEADGRVETYTAKVPTGKGTRDVEAYRRTTLPGGGK